MIIDIKKTVGNLSGGEKARLTLSKLIMRKNNVLLLDEPTNHLDIPTREALENALVDFEGTVISVSHDRYFIKKLASRVIDIGRSPMLDHHGDYESYIARISQLDGSVQTSQKNDTVSDSKAQYLENKKNQAEKRKLENYIKKTKDFIEKAEKKLEALEKEIEASACDYMKLMELDREKTDLEEQLLEAYEGIEEAEEKLSAF